MERVIVDELLLRGEVGGAEYSESCIKGTVLGDCAWVEATIGAGIGGWPLGLGGLELLPLPWSPLFPSLENTIDNVNPNAGMMI